jgi:hypothetical protein
MKRKTSSAALSDDLRQWAAENRLLGMSDERIAALRVDQGIDACAAAEEIQALASHP